MQKRILWIVVFLLSLLLATGLFSHVSSEKTSLLCLSRSVTELLLENEDVRMVFGVEDGGEVML